MGLVRLVSFLSGVEIGINGISGISLLFERNGVKKKMEIQLMGCLCFPNGMNLGLIGIGQITNGVKK